MRLYQIMKLTLGTTIIISQAAFVAVAAFAPSSSFTTFRQSQVENYVFSSLLSNKSSSSSRRNRRITGMNMMFDQLASAINDIAKNIGGRQRSVKSH
jgi:hypothetical protein